jgi:N-methylhydantoinase A/oxoprolinase/acetone carboxylase beta subunit
MRDFSFYIDRGGTFTDVVASIQSDNTTRLRVTKVGVLCSRGN